MKKYYVQTRHVYPNVEVLAAREPHLEYYCASDVDARIAQLEKGYDELRTVCNRQQHRLKNYEQWSEYACRRFREETGKDLQTQAASS